VLIDAAMMNLLAVLPCITWSATVPCSPWSASTLRGNQTVVVSGNGDSAKKLSSQTCAKSTV
jgi:hypothetical protein